MATSTTRDIVTEGLVSDLALTEDRNAYIMSDWATGDNEAFATWLAQYELPYGEEVEALLERFYGVPATATSEYGGGSAATYWHLDGDVVIGLGTGGSSGYWRIPVAALRNMPEVTDYAEITTEDEDA